jgi:hypothetical protein
MQSCPDNSGTDRSHRRLSTRRVGPPVERGFQLIELIVRQIFQADQAVAGLLTGPDQLVQFEVQGFGIGVLGMLDQEDHQERDDGCARIDDQLPRVGIAEQRSDERPQDDDRHGTEEG